MHLSTSDTDKVSVVCVALAPDWKNKEMFLLFLGGGQPKQVAGPGFLLTTPGIYQMFEVGFQNLHV